MGQIEIAILLGIRKSGKQKTFKEILDEAGVSYTASQALDAADALESKGLIEQVTYQLPVSIRAELSPEGIKAVSLLSADS